MPDFLFPSLDFPDRTTVTVGEIADKLGYSPKHICNLIEDGSLIDIDGRRKGRAKRSTRVPIESYHAFLLTRLSTEESFVRDQMERAKKSHDQLSLALRIHTHETNE